LNTKFWEELITYFSLTRHGPHLKRRVQQFFYYCVCIRYRGNVCTEPLPSNDRGNNRHRQQRDIISLLYFIFQNNKSRLTLVICGGQVASSNLCWGGDCTQHFQGSAGVTPRCRQPPLLSTFFPMHLLLIISSLDAVWSEETLQISPKETNE
jgi:hypothetical protein